MNFYTLLGIPRDADQVMIRSAFCVLARQYHPDTGSGSSAEKFCEVAQAYETLIDPVRRRDYDSSLRRSEIPQIHVEPMVATSVIFPDQEISDTWGQFQFAPAHRSFELHDVLSELFRCLEDDLFFPRRH